MFSVNNTQWVHTVVASSGTSVTWPIGATIFSAWAIDSGVSGHNPVGITPTGVVSVVASTEITVFGLFK